MQDDATKSKSSLTFDTATATIRGARDYQEDALISSFPVGQCSGFAVVADGMGGAVAGNVASALVTTECFCQLKMKDAAIEDGSMDIPLTLRMMAEDANDRIKSRTREDDETTGMGATLLAPVIRDDRLFWISIGDSPLLLFRDGALRQLNQDHSMAPQIDMMVKMGAMSAEVAAKHPDRNTLTSVLNGESIESIDCPPVPITLRADDIIIAASDGLQFLPNAMIANTLNLLKGGRSVEIANALLGGINMLADPTQDNVAIIVIKMIAPTGATTSTELENMPVLAMADDTPTAPVAPTPAPEKPAEPVKDESKAYWYRGQKYYKD